jgi:nucleoside-diphosphate-sugar epimerase
MAQILVTGAGGFVGAALCPALAAAGHRVIAGLRRPAPDEARFAAGIAPRVIGDIGPGRDWALLLCGADIVIHLAQRAHRRADRKALAAEPAAAAALAAAAARQGVRRFVYLSSIKAMAEATAPGRKLRAGDPSHPEDAYGRAKRASEVALARAAGATGIELVVVRPPLVYGPGVGGNFRALARLAASGLPLPFAGLANRRSLIYIENLAQLIAAVATHPAAAGQVLLAADGAALPLCRLIRILAAGQGRRARLLAVPRPVFAPLRRLPGIGPAVARLTLPLEVDDAATRALLGWTPPHQAEAALLLTARALAAARPIREPAGA